MTQQNDLWTRLTRQAQAVDPAARPDARLVAKVLGEWRRFRPTEESAIGVWQRLSLRVALAAGVTMLAVLVLGGGAIAEEMGQGLSFLRDICDVEVLP